MSDKETKTISRSTYLQALALFTMGRRRYFEARAFETELGKLLGIADDMSYAGHVSDAMYESGDGNFDVALEREGVVVAQDADNEQA